MSRLQNSAGGEVTTRLLLLLLGLMLLVPAANKFLYYCHFYLSGIHTHGIVAHSSAGRDLGGRPLIQYHDEQGLLHEFKSKAKTHWFVRPVKGEKIKILFDRDKPEKAIADTFSYYVFLPLLFIAAGCYCCFKSIWFHSSARLKNQSCGQNCSLMKK